jgi:TonB family protein
MGIETSSNERAQYALVAVGPPVAPEEVECDERAVELVILWGDEAVLHVEHLSPPRPFYVGDPARSDGKGSRREPVDFLVDRRVLGADRVPLLVPHGDGVAVVIPPGARGDVAVGEAWTSFDQLRSDGKLVPCAALPGAHQFALPDGATATVRFGGFTFVTRPVAKGKKVAGHGKLDRRLLAYVGGSALLFAALLLMFHFLPPSAGALSLDSLDTDNRLVRFAMQPPEARAEAPEWQSQASATEGAERDGKRHEGDEGEMGRKDAPRASRRHAIAGPAHNPDPHLAREAAKELASTAGILGTLRAMTGAWNAPTSPFGRDTAIGSDAMNALGNLLGQLPGEGFGFHGLGMRGTGRGADGDGKGTIGLTTFGTVGSRAGDYGARTSPLGHRRSAVPRISSGSAQVRGSLAKEVIRRVIQRHLNEVRFCYEQDLAQQPDLAGRVAVRFIVSPTGAVQSAGVHESTLGAPRAEGCIAQAVRRWSFPSPEGGGIVIVTYPFVLTAAGG